MEPEKAVLVRSVSRKVSATFLCSSRRKFGSESSEFLLKRRKNIVPCVTDFIVLLAASLELLLEKY